MSGGRLIYLPVKQAIQPATGFCIAEHHWIVHPEYGVAFHCKSLLSEQGEPSPQCNLLESTARHVQQRLYPGHDVRYLPVVFTRHAQTEWLRQIRAMRLSA